MHHIIARWEDLEFLLHYRSFTKKLFWFAYMATSTAFATGLYTVLAPHLLWLAITVCILTSLLPIFSQDGPSWWMAHLETEISVGSDFQFRAPRYGVASSPSVIGFYVGNIRKQHMLLQGAQNWVSWNQNYVILTHNIYGLCTWVLLFYFQVGHPTTLLLC